jgi:hypothetical protein
MFKREPGHYWVTWSELADAELVARKPGPLIGQWDGNFWWFIRSDIYRFDCEVKVLGSVLAPPQRVPSPRPVPVKVAAHF